MDQDRRFPKAPRKGFSNSIGCCGGGIGKNRNYGGACKKTFGESHGQKRRRKMKTRVVLALAALSHAPLLVAGDKAAYPKEKVAEFIVEKLDITSLPSGPRRKKERKLLPITDSRHRGWTKTKLSSRPWAERGDCLSSSRPAALRNLRVRCGAGAKCRRGKDAKCSPPEKERL